MVQLKVFGAKPEEVVAVDVDNNVVGEEGQNKRLDAQRRRYD